MISRQHRFHGRAAFRRAQAHSQTVRGRSMALRYTPTGRPGGYRLAVVVSRKVSKSAVIRNRIRRRLFEYVRSLSGTFGAPHDLILVVYDAGVAGVPAATLAAEVDRLFRKAQLLTNPALSHGIVEERRKT